VKYLKTLQLLQSKKEVNFSSVPIKLCQKLLDEGLIQVKVISANKKKIIITNEFNKVYKNLNEIEKATTRANLIRLDQHTKIKKISPQAGLYVNGNCKFGDVTLPICQNSVLFLKDIPTIPKDILVICVENFENIVYAEKQFKYFALTNILFVYRNRSMLKFIENLENEIIYFGDFDLAGIFIYQTEILPKNKNISFFIPSNIEECIIKFGSKKLYEKQLNKYKVSSSNSDISKLINIINNEQKSLEQEYFIGE